MMKLMSNFVAGFCVVLAGLCLPRPVAAQNLDQSNGQLRRHPLVYVTDTQGHETKGKLMSWSGSEIALETEAGPRTFKPGEAMRLDLRGDSVKNGAVIGLISGAAMGALASAGCDCDARPVIFVMSAGIYTLVGAGIDALIPGRTQLWSAGTGGNAANRRSARNGLVLRLLPERRSAFVGWRVK
jgi:hypothetical protein